MFLKYRLAAPSRIGSLKRYLMSGNRALAAGLRQEESFADEIERLRADAERHGGFMSGYLSFLHEGLVPASIALEVVDQALAESLLRPAPAIIVVHGPPIEPTAVHAQFMVAYRGASSTKISRTVARKSLTAALADVAGQYGWTATPGPPRRLGGTTVAGEIFRDDLTLASWIKENLAPDALNRSTTADELAEELAKVGLSYELSARNDGLLRDHSTNRFVRASILGPGYQRDALVERFGAIPSRRFDPALAIKTYANADRRTPYFTDHQRAAHRRAREEWERNVRPVYTLRRREVYDAHAERVDAIKARFKMLKSALPPVEPDLSKSEYRSLVAFRQRVRKALRTSRADQLEQAKRELYEDLARVFGGELRKPARFIRTWLREQQQPPENPCRIERTPAAGSPEGPWRGAPAIGGGTDLFLGRKRLATDDGRTIRILDPTLEEGLIARLTGAPCRVHGPDEFRQRALHALRERGVDAGDGGPDPPHYGDRNMAETALALQALGIDTTVDGKPLTSQTCVFAASEVRVTDGAVVAVRREDLPAAVEQLGEPHILAGNVALYVTDSADEADELIEQLGELSVLNPLLTPGAKYERTSRKLEARKRPSVLPGEPWERERGRSRHR